MAAHPAAADKPTGVVDRDTLEEAWRGLVGSGVFPSTGPPRRFGSSCPRTCFVPWAAQPGRAGAYPLTCERNALA
jgi:hypothetical protein